MKNINPLINPHIAMTAFLVACAGANAAAIGYISRVHEETVTRMQDGVARGLVEHGDVRDGLRIENRAGDFTFRYENHCFEIEVSGHPTLSNPRGLRHFTVC